jgi:hypothetical protein
MLPLYQVDGISEITLHDARRHTSKDFFFCKAAQAVGETGECGSGCKDYAPRNGKSGCCKHFSNALYELTGNLKTFKIKL